MSGEEEWGEEPKLKPVYPRPPDLHNLLNEFGNRRIPKRASRRMKFLGLEEETPSLGSGGGHEIFTHGNTNYDLATGPEAPNVRRPHPAEWVEGIVSPENSETAKKVVKARKKMSKGQKSLSKTRGRSTKK